MMRLNTVYALRHNPTGKVYVGATYHDVEFRINQHMSALRGNRHPVEKMQEDFNKYGDDYSYFILYQSTDSFEVSKQEKMYMGLLRTRDPEKGYNYKDITRDVSLDQFQEHKISK